MFWEGDAMNDPLALALELREYGMAAIPIIPGTKRPPVKIKPFFEQGPQPFQLPILFSNQPVEVAVLGGTPSDRLAIIDCDNQRVFDDMVRTLNYPATWLVKTYRGGHIYARFPIAVKSTRGNGFDVQSQFKYALAPGAMHPKGVRYEFIQRTQNVIELPLAALPGVTLEPARVRPDGMPRRAWKLLNGDLQWQGVFASRSEAEYSIVMSMVNAGFGIDRITLLFSKYAYTDSHYRNLISERNGRTADQWLARMYESAMEYAQAHRSKGCESALRLRQWADEQAWDGRSGAYTRAVFLAHIEIAERVGRITYQAGVRELAERAGIGIHAASNANKRLIDQKLVELVKGNTSSLATAWKLNSSVARGNTPLHLEVQGVFPLATNIASHDVFRRAGLGKCAAQIWAILQPSKEPMRVSEIAEVTGRHRVTVQDALTRMCQLGMAHCDMSGAGVVWSSVTGVNLDEIAREIGTQGIGAEQKVKHAKERAAHKQRIERLVKRRVQCSD